MDLYFNEEIPAEIIVGGWLFFRAKVEYTEEQLARLGSRQAWLKIQSIDSSACINRLMGLEGAIRKIKKTELPEDVKKELKEFYQEHKLPFY